MNKNDVEMMCILNTALLLVAGIKLMSYMRINESMGALEFLIGECLKDCSAFIVFFTFWNVLFSLFYQVQGVDSDSEDYKDLNVFNRMFLATYEDSVGNINPPTYKFWTSGEDGHSMTKIEGFMVGLIWLTWFLN